MHTSVLLDFIAIDVRPRDWPKKTWREFVEKRVVDMTDRRVRSCEKQ